MNSLRITVIAPFITSMLILMIGAVSHSHAAAPEISTNLQGQATSATNTEAKLTAAEPKPKFTKDQVKKRLKELRDLLDQGLILQDFHDRKVRECEVAP